MTNPQAHHYRPDIDGLRALAILPVVFYHYHVAPFSGGFVGVDIFFVISGYLITSLVHGEIGEGRFSISTFYERRVRRIFPALFAMLAVVTVACAFILFPADFTRYASSLFATAFFASNVEFWSELGYFDVASEQKPLLHLWSIAVEEQFYLLFPAILMLIGAKAKRRALIVVGLIFLASFAYSIWQVSHDAATAFYLLPARMWELMLGALLAIGAFAPPASRLLREGLGAAGLALIGWSVFAFTRATPFPGASALLPCLGTALVIYTGTAERTSVNIALSARPVVFIGLISYSLYLWHWPLYVLARYVLFREPGAMETAALIVASFGLAVLSWRFVERPFRQRKWKLSRRSLFGGALAAMAATAVCGIAVFESGGLPQRLPPDVRKILAEETDAEPRFKTCFGFTADDVRAGKLCRFGRASAKTPSFILWGDSHADAFLPAVEDVASRENRAGLLAGTDSCPPLLGVTRPDAWKCKPFNDAVAKLALDPWITDVILDARWAKNAEGTSYGDEPPGRILLYDDEGRGMTSETTHAVFLRGLERTVAALTRAGKRVILIGSVPEIGWPVPAVLARMKLAGDERDMSQPLAVFLRRQHFVRLAFAQMQKDYGARVVYPDQVLCSAVSCKVTQNGTPLYRDEHHLSAYGARLLEPLLAKAF
jgi:peptidoglycan/LPS O-acetylase OafA/YrhL